MSAFTFEGPIWLIGCGNMAGAMLRRWLDCGLDPSEVTVVRKSGAPVAGGITVLTAPPPDGPVPAMVMLGVKPQMLDLVAPDLEAVLGEETLLVSILAGVELDALRRRFATPRDIVRAMPNTPVALGVRSALEAALFNPLTPAATRAAIPGQLQVLSAFARLPADAVITMRP